MDIPFVFIRFQLMLRIEDAHSKSERVFVFFPFRFSPIWGFWGSPQTHGGMTELEILSNSRGHCGERSPF